MPLLLLFFVACGSQVSDYSDGDDYIPYEYEYTKASDVYSVSDNGATEKMADIIHPNEDVYRDVLHSIVNDTALLAHIEAVIGAPLHFYEDSFQGLPFITILPSRNVIVSGLTDWAQTLTVFLRPDHTTSSSYWIFEAYDISNDGIVLVEPFYSKGAKQRISDSETFIMRIYQEGNGMNGDWEDFNFAEREIAGENWVEEAIQHIHDIAGITIRDIWVEENVLYIMKSPIDIFIPWGPASYRSVLLYLTGASLPGVEYVFLTNVEPGSFRWSDWIEFDDDWNFAYTGRKVLRGHHWAWSGIGEIENKVLEFFEQKLYGDLNVMDEYIRLISGHEARLHYLYRGLRTGIAGIHHMDRMFYSIWCGELWLTRAGDHVGRIPWGWFYISEDFYDIFWISATDYENLLTIDEWRSSAFYPNF